MGKRVLAILSAFMILGGLAYYSGMLYSEKASLADEPYLKDAGAVLIEAQLLQIRNMQREEKERQTAVDGARQEAALQGDTVLAQTAPDSYYLMEENGYVTIYLADQTTLYEYTNITMDMLPPYLQAEIQAGKSVAGERELYDFLENYSS